MNQKKKIEGIYLDLIKLPFSFRILIILIKKIRNLILSKRIYIFMFKLSISYRKLKL